jgi:hypothetical protein
MRQSKPGGWRSSGESVGGMQKALIFVYKNMYNGSKMTVHPGG